MKLYFEHFHAELTFIFFAEYKLIFSWGCKSSLSIVGDPLKCQGWGNTPCSTYTAFFVTHSSFSLLFPSAFSS